MKKDGWKFALLAVGAAAIIFTAARFVLDRDPLPDRTWVLYVDVVDGQLYEVRQRGTMPLPLRHPDDDGRYSIFPVDRTDGGQFIIDQMYMPSTLDGLGFDEMSAVPDANSGVVNVQSTEPIRLRI